jgi:UDP-2,3-diacylglucosamine pyrophosphatase LpxH
MIVIISDLHFTDGTTSNYSSNGEDLFNINPEAFRIFFRKISSIIERRPWIETVTFIYNGDIFDLLRTHVWFESSKNELPWSLPLEKGKVGKKCDEILKKIVDHNQESLSWLSGTHVDFKKTWKAAAEIYRIYIPGNHDRIINLHTSCRRQVNKHLLKKTGSSRFTTFYMDQDFHQTLVMHGHESDAFNCEFDQKGNPKYSAVPIGDPMTTILFARIGYEAEKLSINKEAKKRFKDIDNVRPAIATIRYVQDIIRDFNIEKKVKGMLIGIVEKFKDLEFYKKWEKDHDRINIGYDEADKLQFALRAIGLLGAKVPAGLLEKLSAFVKDDSCVKLAQKKLERDLAQNIRYCVFGHTHEPLHVPLYFDEELKMEKHYLNTGTFRTTFSQTFNKELFIRFQRMSYVIIYGPYEFDKREKAPMYEMWSGLRMHH